MQKSLQRDELIIIIKKSQPYLLLSQAQRPTPQGDFSGYPFFWQWLFQGENQQALPAFLKHGTSAILRNSAPEEPHDAPKPLRAYHWSN